MMVMRAETITTMATPIVPYRRSGVLKRMERSKKPTFSVFMAMNGP